MNGARGLCMVIALVTASSGCRDAPVPRQSTTKSAAVESTSRAPTSPARGNSIVGLMEARFREAKPSVRLVEIYDIVRVPYAGNTRYVLLALGHGDHLGWRDVSEVGEIFGVFGADSSLSHITKVLDIFPTPRMGDYELLFDRRRVADSVVIRGKGASYGDGPMRRAYAVSSK